MQKPKLKDIHKIADAIALQVSSPQLINRSASLDKSCSRSVESTPASLSRFRDHWEQTASITRFSRRESRKRRRDSDREKDGEIIQRRTKRSESEHVWAWGKFGASTSVPFSSCLDGNSSDVKKTTVQDLFTDVDRFKYDLDLSSLTAKIDIANLANSKSMPERRGAGMGYNAIEKEENRDSSLVLQDNQSATPNVETNEQVSPLSPLSPATASISNNNNSNNNNNAIVKDDKFEGSLFDDPNLLNELPKTPIYVTSKTNASNTNSSTLSNNIGNDQNSVMTSSEIDASNMISSLPNIASNHSSIQLDLENFDYDKNGYDTIDSTRDTQDLHQKKLVSTFGNLNETEYKHEAHKNDIAHRRLVSESDYSKLILGAQERNEDGKSEPICLSEAERERINMAKEIFRNQLLSMRHNHSYGHARHTSYDLKGLEQSKLQESAKVTQFKGLQSATKIVRTAEVDENLFESKLVSGSNYEEILKRQKEEETKSTPRKSTTIFSPQTIEAKHTFQQLEKENYIKPTSTRHKKMDSKIFRDVAGNT